MQQRRSPEQEQTSAGLAAIELRETSIHQPRIGVDQRCQFVEASPEQGQHGRRIVPGLPTHHE